MSCVEEVVPVRDPSAPDDSTCRRSYFHIDMTPSVQHTSLVSNRSQPVPSALKLQKGVIRSNCMDCLDRTNVAQAAIAKDALQRQLRAVGVLSHKEKVDQHDDFMHIFRNGAFSEVEGSRGSTSLN